MDTHDDTVAHAAPVTGRDHPRSKLRGIFLAVAALAIVLDTVTKSVMVAALDPGQPVRVADGLLYFTLTRNSGAAFSMLSDYTGILSLLAVVVVGVIGWYAWRRLGSPWWALALGLIAGGALGNLVDRVFREPGPLQGHVVDFLSVFDPYGGVWPIFNLADSCLVVGVVVVIALELTGRRIEGPAPGGPSQGGSGES